MNKKILFRVDGGGNIGFGHLIRTIAIHNQIKKTNPNISTFFVSKMDNYLNEKLEKLRIPIIFIPESTEEPVFLLELIQNLEPDILFIDLNKSYGLDDIKILNKLTKVILFNDLSESVIESTMAIIPSAHKSWNELQLYSGMHNFFYGIEFVVLNENVLSLRDKFSVVPDTVAVITGGSDPKNVMLTICKLLQNEELKHIKFKLFIGDGYLYKDELKKSLEVVNYENIKIVDYNLNDILKAEIVISTFGVTTYELLYLGKALISIAHADLNAEGSYELANKYNCFIDLGHINNISGKVLTQTILDLETDKDRRNEMIEIGKRIIDGKGVERVSSLLINLL